MASIPTGTCYKLNFIQANMPVPADPSDDLSRLFEAWKKGDREAEEAFYDVVYHQLREMARRQMRNERQGHTLQTTALVHEVYLKLFNSNVDWQDSAHFFVVAATVMRRVLVDHARSRQAAKRSGGRRVEINEVMLVSPSNLEGILAVDQALNRLAEIDARQANIVELHLFAGLSLEETARVLDISKRTVQRDWNFALAWLSKEILAN
jgi:RNA polymerase sigma-70 factor (ECF subfamily)